MCGLSLDLHLIILVLIMLLVGAFGGYLNYLHNFDTKLETDEKMNKQKKLKYVLLGIGASLLVPAFLKMIASDLIKVGEGDNINYLIFSGFCLVAAIFSRRFITNIGERILEAAKQAEITSQEAKKQSESNKRELSNTKERIEDVKLAVNLKYTGNEGFSSPSDTDIKELLELTDSYVSRTSVADYTQRLRLKAEMGRKMGQLIVSKNLNPNELFNNYPSEGMFLGLAYAVELQPAESLLSLLNSVAAVASQLYTKYIILLAYRAMATSGFVKKNDVTQVVDIVNGFKSKADGPLLKGIEDTLHVLKYS